MRTLLMLHRKICIIFKCLTSITVFTFIQQGASLKNTAAEIKSVLNGNHFRFTTMQALELNNLKKSTI